MSDKTPSRGNGDEEKFHLGANDAISHCRWNYEGFDGEKTFEYVCSANKEKPRWEESTQ